LTELEIFPEDEALLHSPARHIGLADRVETDVLILGAGNA
jgi:hypothetical protein